MKWCRNGIPQSQWASLEGYYHNGEEDGTNQGLQVRREDLVTSPKQLCSNQGQESFDGSDSYSFPFIRKGVAFPEARVSQQSDPATL